MLSYRDSIAQRLDAALLPRGLGPRPWRDAQFRAVFRAVDNSAFLFVFANNVLGALVLGKFTPTINNPTMKAVRALAYICAGALQLLAARRWPDTYYRYRHYLLVLLRVPRVVRMASLPGAVRGWLHDVSGHQHASVYIGGGLVQSKMLMAVACLLGVSGCMHTLMHVVAVPLPLVPQAAFQLLCFSILAVSHLAPAAASLATTAFVPQLHGICTSLNSVLFVMYSPVESMHLLLPHANKACDTNGSELMVLFVLLYVVLVLPLYYAYRLEQECRHRMLTPPGGGPAAPRALMLQQDLLWVGLHDCVALLLVAMMCWAATLAAQPYLPLLVQPLAEAPQAAAAFL